MSLALVIPAWNEGLRIAPVIETALESVVLDHVIVVDDGSHDDTFDIASEFGVNVLRHNVNWGKGEALQTGFVKAKELGASTLLFLDADLKGLQVEHIDALVSPVVEGRASMTIGYLDRTVLQKSVLKRWGAFSGQRALPISLWEQLADENRTGFKVEAGLNILTRHLGIHNDIERVELEGVTHIGKREKEPTILRAGLAYGRTYGSALLTYAGL